MGIRFLISFSLLALIFHKKIAAASRGTWLRGMAIGVGFFLTMSFELTGLITTSSSTTAFIENSAVVFVPLIETILAKKLPSRVTVMSTVIALLGLCCLTIKGARLAFTPGELLCLMAAISYAATIIITDRVTSDDDPLALGIIQLFFIGLFGMIVAFLFETPRIPSTFIEWRAVLYLAVVCSGIGFTIQPLAQKYTTSERTGLFTAVNPLVAAVLGIIFLQERFGVLSLIGGILVLFSIFYAPASEAGLFRRSRIRRPGENLTDTAKDNVEK